MIEVPGFQGGAGEVGAPQIGAEALAGLEVGIFQMGLGENGLVEVGFAQVGAAQIRLGQVGAPQVEAPQIGPRSGATQQQLTAARFGQDRGPRVGELQAPRPFPTDTLQPGGLLAGCRKIHPRQLGVCEEGTA